MGLLCLKPNKISVLFCCSHNGSYFILKDKVVMYSECSISQQFSAHTIYNREGKKDISNAGKWSISR